MDSEFLIKQMISFSFQVSLMGTGVCLKGTKMYPLSIARLFAFYDVYLN